MQRKKVIFAATFLLLVLGVVAMFYLTQIREPKIAVGPDTTVIDQPIREDGFIDYCKALNQLRSKGIDPDRNVVVALAEIFGSELCDAIKEPEFREKLGLNGTPSAVYVPPDSIPGLNDYRKDLDDFEWIVAGHRSWTEQEFPLTKKWLDANQATFERIENHIIKSDQCFVPCHGFSGHVRAGLTHSLRALARLLYARFYYELAHENWDQAAECSMQLKDLAGISQQLLLYPYLEVSAIFLQAHLSRENELIRDCDWDSKKCLARLKTISTNEVDFSFVDYADHELRYMNLECLQRWIVDGDVLDSSPEFSIYPSEFYRADVDEIARRINSDINRIIQVLEIEDRKTMLIEAKKLASEFERACNEVSNGVKYSLLDLRGDRTKILSNKVAVKLGPYHILHTSVESILKTRTIQDLVVLGWALKSYQVNKGEYPNSLEDLAPDLLPSIPADSFGGGQFIYQRQGEGFILYSIGENQRDDLGNNEFDGGPRGTDDIKISIGD